MNLQKMGEFLKCLRKEKGITQEQLAEHFYISSRTVSRWETGRNVPDIDMLVELADYYSVDIRELIDGERRSEKMDGETKETIKKVADYVKQERKIRELKLSIILVASMGLLVICNLLFGFGNDSLLYGIVAETICYDIIEFVTGFYIGVTGIYCLNFCGVFDKIKQWKKK